MAAKSRTKQLDNDVLQYIIQNGGTGPNPVCENAGQKQGRSYTKVWASMLRLERQGMIKSEPEIGSLGERWWYIPPEARPKQPEPVPQRASAEPPTTEFGDVLDTVDPAWSEY